MDKTNIQKFIDSNVFEFTPAGKKFLLSNQGQSFFVELLRPQKILDRVIFIEEKYDYIIDKVFGAGSYGVVFRITNHKGEHKAVKVGPVLLDFKKYSEQLGIQNSIAKYEMAPEVDESMYALLNPAITRWFKKPPQSYYITFMDTIHSELPDFIQSVPTTNLSRAFDCLLDKKYVSYLVHGDMHIENIVLLKDGRTLGFIDFDLSRIIKSQEGREVGILDFIPLIESLKESKRPKSKRLIEHLLQYYHRTFNISIKPENLQRRKGGGYEYAVKDNRGVMKLNSYVAIIPAVEARGIIKNIKFIFPNLGLPVVTQ